MNATFDHERFVKAFRNRREASDSINSLLDEPTILGLLPVIKNLSIIDVGCGLGHIAQKLVDAGAGSVIAIDPSPVMIREARSLFAHSPIDFRVGDILQLSLGETFDVVVSSMVLHFIEDLPAFLGCVAQLLRPNGLFIFSQRHPIHTCKPQHASNPSEPAWLVQTYFDEAVREYIWLGQGLRLYHRTFESIVKNLWKAGFALEDLREPHIDANLARTSERLLEASSVPMILACRCRKHSSTR
jgi:2-polyprenyl-3-methyl-5-hydroxy-6-metoxy-1,4-benzoquinol methylase